MKFIIERPEENIVNLARRLGYIPKDITEGEFNLVRPLRGGEYPRFHLYLKEDKGRGALLFSLHLDQKKPSYTGTPAHGGEYEGEVVERERERIKEIIGE